MENRDRLKGLILWSIEDYTPFDLAIWMNMTVRGQGDIRAVVLYIADKRTFAVRRWFSNPPATYTKKAFFTNQRFINAVVAKIPDHIIAELTAHSIALSARAG